MSLFRKQKPDESVKPDYSSQRQGHMALLTVDLERHPDYEPLPVKFFLYGRTARILCIDRDVEFKVGEDGKMGASGFGVFDDETGELAYYERVTIFPHCTFGWYLDETQKQKQIQDQRDNPKIL